MAGRFDPFNLACLEAIPCLHVPSFGDRARTNNPSTNSMKLPKNSCAGEDRIGRTDGLLLPTTGWYEYGTYLEYLHRAALHMYGSTVRLFDHSCDDPTSACGGWRRRRSATITLQHVLGTLQRGLRMPTALACNRYLAPPNHYGNKRTGGYPSVRLRPPPCVVERNMCRSSS